MWFKDKKAATAAQFAEKLPLSLMKKGRVVLNSTFKYNLYQSLSGAEIELPLISCLMVTKNRVEQAKCAIQCFLNQTYAHRELVIIDDGEDEGLAEYTQQLQDSRIKYLHLPSENKTLGELRNLAVKTASGTYICQWDDDDLSDSLRLEVQMAVLLALAAEVCFLQRWMLWWPSSRRWAISRIRIWEGSILCLKSLVPAYPEQRQGEDTSVVGQIIQHCRVALLDCPQLYIYVIHGHNTSASPEQFEQYWQSADETYEEDLYDYILDLQARRIPSIVDYQWKCTLKGQIISRSVTQLFQTDMTKGTDGVLDLKKRYKVGIVITIYNRPTYLKATLNALKLSNLGDALICLVDDSSYFPETLEMVNDFTLDSIPIHKVVNSKNLGVKNALKIGWDFLVDKCDYLCNLDSDALVKQDWLSTLVSVYERYIAENPNHIVVATGYNSKSHLTLSESDFYVFKRDIGGVHIFFQNILYYSHIRKSLEYNDWDHYVADIIYSWELGTCSAIIEGEIKGETPEKIFEIPTTSTFICTKPSVIEHLGRLGLHYNFLLNEFVDRAEDF